MKKEPKPEIDVDKIPCAVLKRLINEIKYEKKENQIGAFNRHNRGR